MNSKSQKTVKVTGSLRAPAAADGILQTGVESFGACLDAACAYLKCVVRRSVEENLHSPFALARMFLRAEEYGGMVWGNSVEADWIDNLVATLLTYDYTVISEEEWRGVLQSHSPSPSQVPTLSTSTYPPFSPYDWLCDDGHESLAELLEMLLGLCADPSFPKPKPQGINDLQNIWFEAIKSRINELFESVGMGGLFSPMVLFHDTEGNRLIVPIIRLIPVRPVNTDGTKGRRLHPRAVFTRENAFKLFNACEGIERCHLKASPRFLEVLIRRRNEQAAGGAAPSREAQNPAAGAGGKMGSSRVTNISMLRTSKRTPIDKISSLEKRISKQRLLLSEMPEDAVERIDALLHLQNLKDELMAAQQAVEAAQQGPHESVFQIHNWTAGSEEIQNGKPKSLKEIMAQQATQKGEVMTHIKTIAGLAATEAQAPQSSQRMGCLMPSNFQCTRTRSQVPWMEHVMQSERTVDPSANYVSSGEWRRTRITAAMAAPASASVVEETAPAPAAERDERSWRIFEQVHNEVQEDLDAPVLDEMDGFTPVPKSVPVPASPAPSAPAESDGFTLVKPKEKSVKPTKLCDFYRKPSGCRNGDKCRFLHVDITPAAPAPSAPAAKTESPTPTPVHSVSLEEAVGGSTEEAICRGEIPATHETAAAFAEAALTPIQAAIRAKYLEQNPRMVEVLPPPAPKPATPAESAEHVGGAIFARFLEMNPMFAGKTSPLVGLDPSALAGPIAAALRAALLTQQSE